jgi:hypothetical protein
VYFRSAVAAPGAPATTDAAWAIDARAGAQTYTIKILGINPTSYYSMGIAAYANVTGGKAFQALESPASWSDFQPAATADFTGTIDGTAAATVKTGAANGQTAFTDTAQYRGDIAPSNPATDMTVILIRTQNDCYTPRFQFSYSQGVYKATHFAFYVKQLGGTITQSDPHFIVRADSGTDIRLPFVIAMDPSVNYRFGIVAIAVCKSGPIANSTILQTGDVYSAQVALGTAGGTTVLMNGPFALTGVLTIDASGGAGYGIIDLNTYNGVLKLRREAAFSSIASGECQYVDTGAYRGYHLNDGSNRIFHGRKAGETKATAAGGTGNTGDHDHGTIQTSSEDGTGYHVHDVAIGSHNHSGPSHDHNLDLDDFVREWVNP